MVFELIADSEAAARRAAPILVRLPAGRPMMVEVGVSSGRLAVALLRARQDLRWVGVDNWASEDAQPEAYRATGDRHAHLPPHGARRLMSLAMRRAAEFPDRARIVHMPSVEAAAALAGERFDVAFIDARHDYDGVREDCEAWWPLVRPGGWIGGHDYGARTRRGTQVDEAVDDWASSTGVMVAVDREATWWARKG